MKTIKRANSCKSVVDFKINRSLAKSHKPKAGDVAIFEVLELGSLNAIQDYAGRNCYIFEGDYIMVTFGNRYASNQFEAYVPEAYQEEYDLVGKGGVVGNVVSMYYKLEEKGPTKLKMVGYAVDQGKVINAIYHHKERKVFNPFKQRGFKTILSVGSSMDSGKTTTAAFLCRGLKNAGHKVAYIKLTGTVFNKDKMLCFDCGADYVADFSDLGFPSTYLCSLATLLDVYESLLTDVEAMNPDYLVIEVADGLYQKETSALMNHLPFTESIDHVILSCGNSLAVHAGIELLAPVFGPRLFALGGLFTGSPLMVSEVEEKTCLPILTLEKLVDSSLLNNVLKESITGVAV